MKLPKDCKIVPTDRKRILRDINKYPYIEADIDWYDDPEHPDICTWKDIEGIGYGWLWYGEPKREWVKIIKSLAKSFLKNSLQQKMAIRKFDNGIIYFIPDSDNTCMYVIVLSNEKINLF